MGIKSKCSRVHQTPNGLFETETDWTTYILLQVEKDASYHEIMKPLYWCDASNRKLEVFRSEKWTASNCSESEASLNGTINMWANSDLLAPVPLQNVGVRIYSLELGVELDRLYTDINGHFSTPSDLDPGNYTIEITGDGLWSIPFNVSLCGHLVRNFEIPPAFETSISL